jgi:hypothetical protein
MSSSVLTLASHSQPLPLKILFHVDSGAGQSMCSCPDAFLSLRPCAIEVIGVSGSLPIFGIGSAMLVLTTSTNRFVVGLVHDCLLCQGSPFNLLSVSQFQASGRNSVNFSVASPSLSLTSAGGQAVFPLVLEDGLYSFLAEPIHPNDDRYRSLARFDMTTNSQREDGDGAASVDPRDREIPTELPLGGGTVQNLAGQASDSSLHAPFPSPLGAWSCRLLFDNRHRHRILAFPLTNNTDFDSELRQFCNGFLSPVTAPPARQTYDPTNPLHMTNLSHRFMGIGDERLRRTIELNRGLLPSTGRVPVHPFPQGKFRQGKTPRVNKGKVHHLNRASICEVVFTDTFETGDHKFKYGQAFVDYRSRWGDVIPLRSRTLAGLSGSSAVGILLLWC